MIFYNRNVAFLLEATVADYDERLTSIASDKALFYTSPNFDVRDRLIDSINGMACELGKWLVVMVSCLAFTKAYMAAIGNFRGFTTEPLSSTSVTRDAMLLMCPCVP